MASPALDREAVDQAVARGSDLLKQGKLDDAQNAFRAALLLDSENPRVLALLGLTHFRAGQFPQARPIYEELVERAPTDASHRLNLGLVYLKLGESEKAIGSLEASRALDPSQGRAVSYLGLAYARAGRYAEAYRSFLLAGQNELASEIEINLTPAERDGIHAQLHRSGVEQQPRTKPPKEPPKPAPREAPSGSIEVPMSSASIDVPMSMPAIVIDRPTEEAPPPSVEPRSPASAGSLHSGPPPPDLSQRSMAEIVVDRSPAVATSTPSDDESDAALDEMETRGAAEPGAPATEISAPRMTESLQFVLPEREAVPKPAIGQSMISAAVEVAAPATVAATVSGLRVGWGSTPPVALSQLATEYLVRPEDGDEPFEVTAAGALVIRVSERVLTRLDGIHVTGGELEYEPAMRRSRGHQTNEKFTYGGTPLFSVTGNGYLISVAGDKKFTAVSLDDDILYLREDLVFAFAATLRWENGNVPGLRGKLPVVQFRGDGAVALRTSQPLVRVKLPAQGVIYVDATRLAGWIGRVIPRAVVPPKHGPMGELCVECTGEGVVLVDPVEVTPMMSEARSRSPSKPEPLKSTPPPPPQPAPVDLDVVKTADWLKDDDGSDDDKSSDES